MIFLLRAVRPAAVSPAFFPCHDQTVKKIGPKACDQESSAGLCPEKAVAFQADQGEILQVFRGVEQKQA